MYLLLRLDQLFFEVKISRQKKSFFASLAQTTRNPWISNFQWFQWKSWKYKAIIFSRYVETKSFRLVSRWKKFEEIFAECKQMTEYMREEDSRSLELLEAKEELFDHTFD